MTNNAYSFRSRDVLFAIFMFIALQTLACKASSNNTQKQVIGREVTSQLPSSQSEINRKIEQTAIDYQEYAPVPRGAINDISLPPESEYQQMNGYALLLVIGFSQDKSELPFKRVYVRGDGKISELKLISVGWTNQSTSSDLVIKTLGPNRVDALYLLPIYLLKERGELLVDFAKNREGFRLSTFPNSTLPHIENMPIAEPKSEPSPAALKHMIELSYPGLFKD